MSWDIFVQDLPKDARSIDDIPGGFRPKPIGKRTEVIRRIQELLPEADFSDPAWGHMETEEWSIEFNIGDEAECESIALHVRGGDGVVGVVAGILAHLDLRALDSQTGDFFVAGPAALESFRKWRAYRDHVVKKRAG